MLQLRNKRMHMPIQGTAAESAASFARYMAAVLTSAQLADPVASASLPSSSAQQVARRLGSILQEALLGDSGDAAVETHEGEKHSPREGR